MVVVTSIAIQSYQLGTSSLNNELHHRKIAGKMPALQPLLIRRQPRHALADDQGVDIVGALVSED